MTDARLKHLSQKLMDEQDMRAKYASFAPVEASIAAELIIEVRRLKLIQQCSEDILKRTRQPLILAGSEAEAARKALDSPAAGG